MSMEQITMVNKRNALVLLAGFILAACGQPNNTAREAVGTSAPFSVDDAPAGAPVHNVSVKFPLDWERQTVAAQEHEGFLVHDGMVLGRIGEVPEGGATTPRAQALPDGPTWKNKPIKYWLNSNLPSSVVAVIRDAVTYYNTNTVVRWEATTVETDSMVKFTSDGQDKNHGHTEWHSSNGNLTRATVELSKRASASTVRHEMMHALGFHHEQTRPDRNAYLVVTLPTNDSDIRPKENPIGHYDLVSRMHYDDASDFRFNLQNDDKVRELFKKEVRRYNNLSKDPETDPGTVHQYVGEGTTLSYLDIYALKLKYTVSNIQRPFTVTATQETDPTLIAQAKMSSGQKLLRLSISNNSGFDAESWALRIGFGGTSTPSRLALLGELKDGFLVQNILDPDQPEATRRTEIITPTEGNSRIAKDATLLVYVVMNTGANGQLDVVDFCRINSFDCK